VLVTHLRLSSEPRLLLLKYSNYWYLRVSFNCRCAERSDLHGRGLFQTSLTEGQAAVAAIEPFLDLVRSGALDRLSDSVVDCGGTGKNAMA
jgi:hypothetical protein